MVSASGRGPRRLAGLLVFPAPGVLALLRPVSTVLNGLLNLGLADRDRLDGRLRGRSGLILRRLLWCLVSHDSRL